MRLGLVAALVTLCLLPIAAAQAPEPGDIVLLACDAVQGVEPQAHDALPFCPRAEPAAPAPNEDEAAAPPAPAAPAAPQQAAALADEAVATAGGAAEDPASAPDRIASFLAGVIDFVKELLAIPVSLATRIDARMREMDAAVDSASAAIGDATARGAIAVRDAAATVAASIGSLFERAPDAPHAPLSKPSLDAPQRVLSDLPLGEIRQMLPEG